MNQTEKRKRLRAQLNGPECIIAADMFDPMSARIVELLGYKAGMLSGSVASLVVLGAPNLSLLTLTEFVEQARRVCRASAVPLLVDADHGFGNALNVQRTVVEMEAAGVAAITIDDADLPARFGGEGKALVSLPEAERKMRAALSARQDDALLVIARTAAARGGNIAEAVKRARAYAEAGVDGVFFSGLRTRDQIVALADLAPLPLLLGGIPTEIAEAGFLAAHGVRLFLQGHKIVLTGVQACYEAQKRLAEGTPPEEITNIPSRNLLTTLERGDDYDLWIRDFLHN